METVNPASIARAVVFGGLVLGSLLGLVGRASRFCVRGAIADWVVAGVAAGYGPKVTRAVN